MDLFTVGSRLIAGCLALPFLGIWVIWNIVMTILYYTNIKKSTIPDTTRYEFKSARLRLVYSAVIFLLVFLYTFWPFIWAILFI